MLNAPFSLVIGAAIAKGPDAGCGNVCGVAAPAPTVVRVTVPDPAAFRNDRREYIAVSFTNRFTPQGQPSAS